MSDQTMIYDTDNGGFQLSNQMFEVKNYPIVIRSAGLTEDVMIYQMVGTCQRCQPDDVLWEPVTSCGSAMTLGPNNNSVVITLPGKYSVGDPVNIPTFTGDVNITRESLKGVDSSLLGKSQDCGPVEVELAGNDNDDPLIVEFSEDYEVKLEKGNECDDPLYVEVCNNLELMPVETALASLGYLTDNDGYGIGRVMVLRVTNEETGAVTTSLTAFYEDGTIVENYTGPWEVDLNPLCPPQPFVGAINDLSML